MWLSRRSLFTLCACVSLGLCVFFAAFWVRGYWMNGPGMVGWGATGAGGGTRFVGLSVERDGVSFMAMSVSFRTEAREGWFWDPSFGVVGRPPAGRRADVSVAGVGVSRSASPFGTLRVVTLSYWLLALLTAVPPVCYAVAARAGSRRETGFEVRPPAHA